MRRPDISARITRNLAALREPELTSGPLRVLAVDPGFERSAWCLYESGRVVELDKADNLTVKHHVTAEWSVGTVLAVEMVESYGMPVGVEIFRTVLWAGRMLERWRGERSPVLIPRRTVKLELCGTSRAKDANVAAAVRNALGQPPTRREPNDRYPRRPVADEWAAIAVALTYEQLAREGRDGELETLDGRAAAAAEDAR